jgi:hypothetical protein
MQKWMDYIPFIVMGLVVLGIALLVFTFWRVNNSDETKALREFVFNSKPGEIRSFDIDVYASTTSSSGHKHKSLVQQKLSFNDRRDLDALRNTLATCVESTDTKVASDWIAVLRLHGPSRAVEYRVEKSSDAEAKIFVMSDGLSGWNLGTYRCDQVAALLQTLAAREVKAEKE